MNKDNYTFLMSSVSLLILIGISVVFIFAKAGLFASFCPEQKVNSAIMMIPPTYAFVFGVWAFRSLRLKADFATIVGRPFVVGLAIMMAASYSFAGSACPLMQWRFLLYSVGLVGWTLLKLKIDSLAEPYLSANEDWQRRFERMNMAMVFVVASLLVGGC